MSKIVAAVLVVAALSVMAILSVRFGPRSVAADTDVVFHFATVGDSRQEPKDPRLTAQDAIWLQETRVLSRMIREMQAHHAQALVFNGDMIRGYGTDRAMLDRQYAYWRGMMATLIEAGTYVLPVPGNHEVQVKEVDGRGKTTKLAAVANEQAWRDNMGDLILNTGLWRELTGIAPTAWSVDHAPTASSDGMVSDQRQLSYSFDAGDVHLVAINTDPVNADATVPLNWLSTDFAAAKARGAKHIFLFGHKMAFVYIPDRAVKSDETGIVTKGNVRDDFWNLIEKYHATYFCGHEHIYHASQPRKDAGGTAWQVIVGSGGSPFSFKSHEVTDLDDRTYAWAEVSVYRTGRAHIAVYGFDDSFGKTRLVAAWDLPVGENG